MQVHGWIKKRKKEGQRKKKAKQESDWCTSTGKYTFQLNIIVNHKPQHDNVEATIVGINVEITVAVRNLA